jgi:hypothetical protein
MAGHNFPLAVLRAYARRVLSRIGARKGRTLGSVYLRSKAVQFRILAAQCEEHERLMFAKLHQIADELEALAAEAEPEPNPPKAA